MFAWLSLEALRIWIEHGPGHTLVGPAANAAFHAVAQRGDYAAGYRAVRRILALGEARGYEPDTSHARLVVSLLDSWFEPIENGVQESLRAREGLIAGGDLANAGYTYHQTVVGCWTARRRWTPASPRWTRAWLSRGGPATSRPRSGSTATSGWPACCAAKAQPRPPKRSPPTGTRATRWRCYTSTCAGRSPRPSSATRPSWRDTARRRCGCCPSSPDFP